MVQIPQHFKLQERNEWDPTTVAGWEDHILRDEWNGRMFVVDENRLDTGFSAGNLLFVQINRSSVGIGKTTRRGRANNIVMSEYQTEVYSKYSGRTIETKRISEQSTLHEITSFAGSQYNPYMRFFLHPGWDKEHTMFVSYRGPSDTDAGMFLVQRENGTFDRGLDLQTQPHWLSYYDRIGFIARN